MNMILTLTANGLSGRQGASTLARLAVHLMTAVCGAIMLSGCATTIEHKPSARRYHQPPAPIRIGVLQMENLTDGEYRDSMTRLHPWGFTDLPHIALSKILADEIRGQRMFSGVDLINLSSSTLMGSPLTKQELHQYDAILVGSLFSYKAGGAPHAITYILPTSLLAFVGIPTIPGYINGQLSYELRLVDPHSQSVLWATGRQANQVSLNPIWASLYNGLSIWRRIHNDLASTWVAEVANDLSQAAQSGFIMSQLERARRTQPHSAPIISTATLPPAIAPVPIPARIPPASSGTHWAVIIGVSRYADSRIAGLRYAARDAGALHDWLVAPDGGRLPPSQVRLLTDHHATGGAIRDALFNWLSQALAEDVVTIYFAGHGSPQSPDHPNNLFFLPHDASYDNVAATGFPMWDVETALRRFISARRVVVIADACHSGGVGTPFDVARRTNRGMFVNPIVSGIQNLTEVSEGICVLTASADNQLSQEGEQWGGGHGVFTYHLLKGLRGEADYNNDGVVTLGELIPYLSEQVRRATRNAQTPTVAGKFDPALAIGK